MSVTLWLDTEKEETLELGPTLRAYSAFAEMAHLAGSQWQSTYADLGGVLTACEFQDDAPAPWLTDVRQQATQFLSRYREKLSAQAVWILEQLAGAVAANAAAGLEACGGPGSGVPGPCPGGGKPQEQIRRVGPEQATKENITITDAVKARLTEVGQKIYDRLPPAAQKAVDIGQHLEHKAEGFFKNGQELAKEVARGTGMSDKLVEQTGRVLAYADTVSRWGINWQVGEQALGPVGGHVAAFVGAKVGAFVPTASLAYVGYHMGKAAVTGRNPLAVVKGARERIRGRMGPPAPTGKHAWTAGLTAAVASNDGAQRQFAGAVLQWLDAVPAERRYWAEALLAAALDETRGELLPSLTLAQAEFAGGDPAEVDTAASTPLQAYSPDQSRDDHGRFGEGGGGSAKEPKAPSPRPAGKDPLAKKIEQAKVKVEKAKNGLVKAKKDLADLKAQQKTEKANAKAAVAKVTAKAPVDAAEHVTSTKALFNRANQQGSKLTEADIDKHVAGLGKALNKAQVLEVARGIDVRAPKTKDAALKAIRTTVYNTWRVSNRAEEMTKTYGPGKKK